MAKILYIEDDPIQQSVLTHMLELHGHEVDIAADGVSGVEKAVSGLPDLIIADSMLPRMDGIEAIQAIRQNAEIIQVPIIALSARADKDYKEQVRLAGANEVFSKPVDIHKLILRINSCLENCVQSS